MERSETANIKKWLKEFDGQDAHIDLEELEVLDFCRSIYNVKKEVAE